jgi:hypothetical protein
MTISPTPYDTTLPFCTFEVSGSNLCPVMDCPGHRSSYSSSNLQGKNADHLLLKLRHDRFLPRASYFKTHKSCTVFNTIQYQLPNAPFKRQLTTLSYSTFHLRMSVLPNYAAYTQRTNTMAT